MNNAGYVNVHVGIKTVVGFQSQEFSVSVTEPRMDGEPIEAAIDRTFPLVKRKFDEYMPDTVTDLKVTCLAMNDVKREENAKLKLQARR